MLNKLFVVTLLTAAVTPTVSGAAGAPVAATKWQAACKLKNEFAKTQTRAAAQLTKPATAARTYLEQYMKTKIYLEKVQNGVYTPEQIVLLAYYAEKASKSFKKLQSLEIKKTLTQIRDAARAEAAIGSFVTAMAHITADATHSCLEDEKTPNGPRTATNKKAVRATGCELTKQWTEEGSESADGISEKGFEHAEFKQETDATETGGNAKCTLTAAKANNRLLDTSGGNANVAGEPNYAGGLFFLDTTGLKVRPTNNRQTLPTEAEVLKAALIAADEAKGSTDQFIFKKPSQLKTDPDFNRLWRNIVLKQMPAKADDETAVKDAIERAFGGDTTMEATYNANLKTTMVVNLKGDTPREVELQTLVNFDDLERVLTHYHALNAETLKSKIKEFQDTLNKQDSKAAADTCNKITNKNECDNKPYCSYNETAAEGDKKCKFNSTKAKEKGVSVTQAQTGGTETTTEKCRGKPQGECRSPDCKWDGETCKDSSFLVKNKIALMYAVFLGLVLFQRYLIIL
ncbi:Trypanosome variant surface glycoprotein (A-type) [Trypanosoma brucei equiperdum]|uniref:Trypanosome variant surface glycoprotein (A-type) n=1 Tax=Trypanosoma brucei equiperdum TaxID=630700 RepID=A0A3L6LBB0_9TRYP|nr:Trypanosome variant surface glycoprotein (A-type) [Trypanosoma brucei equiperdum]